MILLIVRYDGIMLVRMAWYTYDSVTTNRVDDDVVDNNIYAGCNGLYVLSDGKQYE